MNNLKQQLLEQTSDLKTQYVSAVKKFAASQFETLVDRAGWSEVQWCEYLGLTPEQSRYRTAGTNEYRMTFPKNFYSTRLARKYDKLKTEAMRAKRMGIDKWIELAIKRAEDHYANSIDKLAGRLLAKGINENNISVTNASVGANIECHVNSDDMSFRCFTIVASGPVQKPHYRFLIK